jgi:hypothetical protein
MVLEWESEQVPEPESGQVSEPVPESGQVLELVLELVLAQVPELVPGLLARRLPPVGLPRIIAPLLEIDFFSYYCVPP